MAEADPVLWALQHGFLPLLDDTVSRVLEQVGASLAPGSYLVGFAVDPAADQPVLIQEMEGPGPRLRYADVADVPAEAVRRTASSAGPATRVSSEQARLAGQRHLLDASRARALEEAMAVAQSGQGRAFFAGRAGRIAGYDVHPVVALDAAALDALPQLPLRGDAGRSTTSLAHEVVLEVLRGSTTALTIAGATQQAWLPDDITTEVVRRAAHHLVLAAEVAAGAVATRDLFETFEALASTAYEGRFSTGGVVLAARDHPQVEVAVRLRRPVPVSDRRQFRKLLEVTGPQLNLLVDGSTIYGLGVVGDDGGSGHDVFRFRLVDHGVWQMSHRDATVLQVADGRPQLPRARLPFPEFERAMREVFPDAAEQHVATIWRLATGVAAQAHGTILVVTEAAAGEAERLAPQALAIEPRPVDDVLLESMTRIDGAVLLTPDTTCHAIGVILDGIATGTGDPGRGARYNSAVRYATTSPGPCLIVIVSEDGMIDLHADRQPGLRRATG